MRVLILTPFSKGEKIGREVPSRKKEVFNNWFLGWPLSEQSEGGLFFSTLYRVFHVTKFNFNT